MNLNAYQKCMFVVVSSFCHLINIPFLQHIFKFQKYIKKNINKTICFARLLLCSSPKSKPFFIPNAYKPNTRNFTARWLTYKPIFFYKLKKKSHSTNDIITNIEYFSSSRGQHAEIGSFHLLFFFL